MRCITSFRLALVTLTLMLCATGRIAHGADVEIRVERFGAFNAYRGADVTALLVRLRSDLPEPTSAIVQWDVENADGDMASYWREVTLPPGQSVTRWLYAKLPSISAISLTSHIFNVSVFEPKTRGEFDNWGRFDSRQRKRKSNRCPWK